MDEINKLYNWLMEHKDFYGWRVVIFDSYPTTYIDMLSPSYQVMVFNKTNDRLLEAVWYSCLHGGCEQGLFSITDIEIMNEDEPMYDIEWRTADDVIERVIKAYGEPK